MSTPKALILVPGAISFAVVFVNVLTVVLMAKSRKLREDYVYKAIVSLSFCDLGSGIFVIGPNVFDVLSGIDGADLHRCFLLQMFSASLFGIASTWHLAVISLAKCVKVIYPLKHWTILSERRLGILLAFVWTLSFCAALVTVAMFPDFYFNERVFYLFRTSIGSFLIDVPVGFLVPSTVIIVANLKLFLVIRKAQQHSVVRTTQEQTNATGTVVPEPDRTMRRSIRSAKNIFVICSVFWLLYLPTVVLVFLPNSSTAFYFICCWTYLTNPFFNNFLYIVLHGTVRKAIRKMFSKPNAVTHIPRV